MFPSTLFTTLWGLDTNPQIDVSKASSKSASDERLILFSVYLEDEPLYSKCKLHIKLKIISHAKQIEKNMSCV